MDQKLANKDEKSNFSFKHFVFYRFDLSVDDIFACYDFNCSLIDSSFNPATCILRANVHV